MTIYAVGDIKIKDREEYDIYSSKFMDVFNKFRGEILAADFDAQCVAGDWDGDRLVVLKFPDKAAFLEWPTSDEYRAIAKHRDAGADVKMILAKEIE